MFQTTDSVTDEPFKTSHKNLMDSAHDDLDFVVLSSKGDQMVHSPCHFSCLRSVGAVTKWQQFCVCIQRLELLKFQFCQKLLFFFFITSRKMGSGRRSSTFGGMFGAVCPACSHAFVFRPFLLWKISNLRLHPEPLRGLITDSWSTQTMARTSKMNSCSDSANEDSAPNGFQNHSMKQKTERLGYLMRFDGSGKPSLKLCMDSEAAGSF